MVDYDQEKYLDDGMKIINNQIYHLSKAIENNNLRQSLKESSVMLAELKTSHLTPKNYYNLFSVVLDEMQYLEQFFKEEYRRGRKIKHLYDSVYQAQSIIPRLYLMITAGRVYIDSGEVPATSMIFELLNAIKGVQNPTRGLFLRYYLLKMIKDKLPDNKEDIDETLKFILQNLEEMNRLWIRLSTGCTGNEKILREKERNELKVLVGENIIRISDLNCLTIEKYQSDVLPKIISILLDSKDYLSQQYILECIIHAFSETYNISCMDNILDTLGKVVATVDIKSLFINLMEKLSKFIEEEQKRKNEDKENNEGESIDIQSQVEKIFGIIKSNIEKIIEENTKSSQVDELRILELQVAFMKFTLKCCPPNQKIETVNHISKSVLVILETLNLSSLGKESIKQILKILTLPLENKISIFKIPAFSELMNFLDYNSRSTLALNILDNLSKVGKKKVFISDEAVNDNDEYDENDILNTTEKITSLLSYLKPLTENSSDSISIEKSQFNYEQSAVSKLAFAVKEQNPIKNYEMLKIIQNIFVNGGEKRTKFTLPSLVNVYINMINNIYAGFYWKEKNELTEKPAYFQAYTKNFEVSVFDSKEKLNSFLLEIYENSLSLILNNLVPSEYPLSYQLLISMLRSININSELEFGDLPNKIYKNIFSILSSIKNEQSDKKLNLLLLLVNTLCSIKCFKEEEYFEFTSGFNAIASSFIKRSDQSQAMLSLSHLYYHDFYSKNEEKCKDCITKAAEYADYAMSTNTQSCLNLYVLIINKFLYYAQKGAGFVSAKKLSKQIDKVNNCINSIKTENKDTDLKEIEGFFSSTIEYINNKKQKGDVQLFLDLNFSISN